MLLTIICALVASYSGKITIAAVWFCTYAALNVARVILCRTPSSKLDRFSHFPILLLGSVRSGIEISLRLHAFLALCAGLVWACVAFLCDAYSSPETLFYLTCVCGITAGSAVYGFAYAAIPICFITPPLGSIVICLIFSGQFESEALAAAVLLYWVALIRGAHVSELLVRESIILKYKATTSQQALKIAHEQVIAYAAEMQEQVTYDSLTGLLSRKGFIEKAELLKPERTVPLCMMFLDLDGFKAINDTFGHRSGDQLLKEVAKRLRTSVPASYALARLGGDEFVILYRLSPTSILPEVLSSRIINSLAPSFTVPASVHVGVSIGIYISHESDINEMLTCADTALYDAKNQGRNQFRFFDESLSQRLQIQRHVQRDLVHALAAEEIEVWFQPIINIHDNALEGFEALLRWQHSKHGWIAPPDIISAAGNTGLSEVLLRFVIRNVASLINQFQASGQTHLRIAMNVSPKEMERLKVDALIKEKLDRFHFPASMLEIEITEETAMNVQAVTQKLAKLAELGIGISIDDFGAGYSSLGSLRLLHASRVKIDRSFIIGLASSKENQALVKAVLNLSEAFKFEVIGEGVENQDDLNMLRKLNCKIAQGYYFGRPMTAQAALCFQPQVGEFGKDSLIHLL
ncbi:putative bifunctional diguanylate cyclase/phosphodiesterase [Herbaspirillum rubrisubalbicans]|uniref:GGDEF-domain containing protein n=2 Tax=Herbaspirillum rubrisubalbicans TaxID=80842 RepID=A0AAD0U641_9BURK|nr:EAL domain-containing protein [Herbaspirillum rubrisubalbicans]AYR23373.1 GGDEF-domain containing protein [Herbaspirillum rubrisubalbicans]